MVTEWQAYYSRIPLQQSPHELVDRFHSLYIG